MASVQASENRIDDLNIISSYMNVHAVFSATTKCSKRPGFWPGAIEAWDLAPSLNHPPREQRKTRSSAHRQINSVIFTFPGHHMRLQNDDKLPNRHSYVLGGSVKGTYRTA
jgi:hypothetical protein